jgi:adenylate cyclase
MRLVEKAIELDPEYAIAHALLASLTYSRWEDGARSSDAALEKAYILAVRALELDDSESTCHALLADQYMQRGFFDLAVRYARRAVEINPNNQWNAADLGSILLYVGEPEEALTWFSRAREIDPYFEEPWYWRAAGLAQMSAHRYADALAMLSRVRVRAPAYAALTAACHAKLGNPESAKASVAECLSMRPDFSVTQFVSRQPFRIPAHAEQLASCLRLAGLPD